MLRFSSWLVFLMIASTPVSRAEGPSLVECLAVKRAAPGSVIERGVSVYLKGFSENQFKRTLWFGNDQRARDQAGARCLERVNTLRCEHNGLEEVSYGRGGVRTSSIGWRLYSRGNVIEHYTNGMFPWSDSAFEQCQKKIIDLAIDVML
jgi:hypothetical protein